MQTTEEKFIEYHNERFEKFGDSPMTFWGSKESQEKRFEALVKLFNRKSNFTVIDIGCGTGGFLDYLVYKGYGDFRYFGFDINQKYIDIANEKFGKVLIWINSPDSKNKTGHSFGCGGFEDVKKIISEIRDVDYAVASGIYCFGSYQTSIRNNYFYDFNEIFPLLNEGYACNFLSQYSDTRNPDVIYHDPQEIFKIAMCHSKKVSLHHDYLPNDFTVIVRK